MFEGQDLPLAFEGQTVKVGDTFKFRSNELIHTVALHPSTLRFLLRFTNRKDEVQWASLKQMVDNPQKWERVA